MQSMALQSQEENMLAPTPLPSGKAQNYGIIENADGVTDVVLPPWRARPTRACAR